MPVKTQHAHSELEYENQEQYKNDTKIRKRSERCLTKAKSIKKQKFVSKKRKTEHLPSINPPI